MGHSSYQNTVGTNLRHDYSPNIYNISAERRLVSPLPIGQYCLALMQIGGISTFL